MGRGRQPAALARGPASDVVHSEDNLTRHALAQPDAQPAPRREGVDAGGQVARASVLVSCGDDLFRSAPSLERDSSVCVTREEILYGTDRMVGRIMIISCGLYITLRVGQLEIRSVRGRAVPCAPWRWGAGIGAGATATGGLARCALARRQGTTPTH